MPFAFESKYWIGDIQNLPLLIYAFLLCLYSFEPKSKLDTQTELGPGELC